LRGAENLRGVEKMKGVRVGTPKLVAVIEFLEWTGIGQTQALARTRQGICH